jgi:hypothetical protein
MFTFPRIINSKPSPVTLSTREGIRALGTGLVAEQSVGFDRPLSRHGPAFLVALKHKPLEN